MKQEIKPVHGMWASRWVFILAATGSAVGLGNIWRFPYITGENGGGAFVLLYLLCIAVVGIPIMAAEVMLGRKGGLSPINSMRKVAADSKVTQRWAGIGYLGALSAFLILSFYSAVASWALYYAWEAVRGVFEGISATQSEAHFNDMLANPGLLLGYHTLFMVLTMVVVARGVKGGLEKAVQILMPLLFVLLLVLVGYAATTQGFKEGVSFLFAFDFSKLTGKAIIVAVGQAFFTLSLGMGAIMAYGAYVPKQVSIPGTAVMISLMDTLVALIAGLVIFPIVFAFGLSEDKGISLIFNTLPLAFGQLAAGQWVGGLFFLLLAVAALTSAISLLEPAVAWLVDGRGWSRIKAACCLAGLAWFVGIGCLLSLNLWSDVHVFNGWTLFDSLDFLTSSVMLPLGGMLIALFVGWRMRQELVREELAGWPSWLYHSWLFILRGVAPVAVAVVLFTSLWEKFAA